MKLKDIIKNLRTVKIEEDRIGDTTLENKNPICFENPTDDVGLILLRFVHAAFSELDVTYGGSVLFNTKTVLAFDKETINVYTTDMKSAKRLLDDEIIPSALSAGYHIGFRSNDKLSVQLTILSRTKLYTINVMYKAINEEHKVNCKNYTAVVPEVHIAEMLNTAAMLHLTVEPQDLIRLSNVIKDTLSLDFDIVVDACSNYFNITVRDIYQFYDKCQRNMLMASKLWSTLNHQQVNDLYAFLDDIVVTYTRKLKLTVPGVFELVCKPIEADCIVGLTYALYYNGLLPEDAVKDVTLLSYDSMGDGNVYLNTITHVNANNTDYCEKLRGFKGVWMPNAERALIDCMLMENDVSKDALNKAIVNYIKKESSLEHLYQVGEYFDVPAIIIDSNIRSALKHAGISDLLK